MKFLIILVFYMISSQVNAQSPWYFGANEAVNLTDGIRYKNTIKNIAGALDPTVSAVNAPAGSLYESTNGKIYVKQDAGSTINWFPLASESLLDNKANRVVGSFSQYVYVNYLSGSNVVCPAIPCGDGSLDRPFQTINFAMSTISDATQNKPYVVGLLGARQIETADILVKPYTSIVGMGQRATYIRAPGFNIKPDPLHSAGTSWVLLKNFYLGGGSGIDWDLQALGGSDCALILENLTIGGILSYKGRNGGGGDFLEAYVGIVFGTITMDSVFAQWQTWETIGAMNFTNTQAVAGLTSTLNNMVLDSNLSATDHSLNLDNVAYNTTTTITTVGTLTLESFRGLPPKSRRTISAGTTINYRDDATMIPYAPATPADWVIQPTDVSVALDMLAASVSGSGYVVGPASATDNALARFDLTTGKLIQDSVGILSDLGALSGLTQINVGNLQAAVNTISSTNVNGNILLNPNGTGEVDFQKNTRSRGNVRFDEHGDITAGANVTLAAPTTKFKRLTGAVTSIDMIPAGSEGQELVLQNATGGTIVINDNTGATTNDRILTGKKAAINLLDEATLVLGYDIVLAKWMVRGQPSQITYSLTSEVSGILPLANGGTNKNMTAVNGGIVWTDADSMEVTAAGTSGQFLQSNGAAAPTWVSLPSAALAVTSKTANYTATTSDGLIQVDATSGAVTITLPAAATMTGLSLYIVKTDSSTNAVIIDGNGAETINGQTTSSIYEQWDSRRVISNGTGWVIL